MSVPNIFKYATKELSQDAVICWLVACAKDAEGPYRERGMEFIRRLWTHYDCATNGPGDRPCTITDITEPQTQHEHIDVYFQARVNDETVSFVIEDKTDGKIDGGQLRRYRDQIPGNKCLICYKTGYVFDDERQEAKNACYAVFSAKDMLAFLNAVPVQDDHEILRQYRAHLTGVVAERNTALKNWDLACDFVQYEFMSKLKDRLVEHKTRWASTLPSGMQSNWPDSVGRGQNLGGGPWTQYWFCRSLFWRLDADRQMLRLMVLTPAASEVGAWNEEVWNRWYEMFLSLGNDIEVPAEAPQRRWRRGDRFVKEGVVGAINLGAALSANADDLEATLEKIVRLHCAFIEQIA